MLLLGAGGMYALLRVLQAMLIYHRPQNLARGTRIDKPLFPIDGAKEMLIRVLCACPVPSSSRCVSPMATLSPTRSAMYV